MSFCCFLSAGNADFRRIKTHAGDCAEADGTMQPGRHAADGEADKKIC